ncbi:hypothetical protein RCH06_002412 [Polaromonas sp. CG_9.5]|nr:hypothetical protein [Polaromonas sp. CG_9.5]
MTRAVDYKYLRLPAQVLGTKIVAMQGKLR